MKKLLCILILNFCFNNIYAQINIEVIDPSNVYTLAATKEPLDSFNFSGFNSGKEIISQFHSPGKDAQDPIYRLSIKTDALVAGTGIAMAAIGTSLDASSMKLTRAQAENFNPKDINWLDRSAAYRYSGDLKKVSDKLGMFTWIAPLGLLLDQEIRGDYATIATMFLESQLLAYSAPIIAKRSIKRYRPYVYNTSLTYDEKTAGNPGESFFASQTTAIFTSAVFISKVYSDYYPDSKLSAFIWGSSLLAAGAITYVCYETGTHYLTDLLAGAIVGGFIGYAVPELHRGKKSNFVVRPGMTSGAYGLTARLDF